MGQQEGRNSARRGRMDCWLSLERKDESKAARQPCGGRRVGPADAPGEERK